MTGFQAKTLSLLLPLLLLSCTATPKIIDPFGRGMASGTAVRPSWASGEVVKTSSGLLQGKRDSHGTLAWLGIPYAAPPIGELRWEPPRPPAPWEGMRDATEFGSPPVQRIPLINYMLGSEDCLFLNIWRPASPEALLPVHVWIHGGDNAVGSADINPDFHGQAFASKTNAVFVSVNFRLGIFGWFRHPALSTGEAVSDSGNFGIMDIIAALRWVRCDIAAFGGDPDNVTVVGESSGALDALALLLAPSARGLFRKVVAESPYLPTATIEEAENFSDRLVRNYLIAKRVAKNESEASGFIASAPPGDLARRLREAEAFDLIALVPQGPIGIQTFPFPIFDGAELPAEGFAAFSDAARTADVPLIIGATKEEAKVFQWLDGMKYRDPLYQPRALLTSARWRAQYVERIADALASGSRKSPVYVYRFDWGAPDESGSSVLGASAGLRLGASHGIDMSFLLQTSTVYGNLFPLPLFTRKNEKGRKALQADIGGYLKNFLWTDTPNDGKSLFWEPWDGKEADPPFILFDADFEKAKLAIERGRTDYPSLLREISAAHPELAGSERLSSLK